MHQLIIVSIAAGLLVPVAAAPPQAQPTNDLGVPAAAAQVNGIDGACPGLNWADFAALGACAEQTCDRDDVTDKTRADACEYLATSEGSHGHWAHVTALAYRGVVDLKLGDLYGMAGDYLEARLEALEAPTDSAESSADVERRSVAERAILALQGAISKDDNAARYVEGLIEWRSRGPDYLAAAFAVRGLDRIERGDLAGATDDYYASRVQAASRCGGIIAFVLYPFRAIGELERLIHKNPESASTDLEVGFENRLRQEKPQIRYPCILR